MAPLYASIKTSLKIHDDRRADAFLDDLKKQTSGQSFPIINDQILSASDETPARRLIRSVFAVSPFLSQLILRTPQKLEQSLSQPPEQTLETLITDLQSNIASSSSQAETMTLLRNFKKHISLHIALADLAGVWGVEEATRSLSIAADAAVSAAIRFLFRQAAQKGDYTPVNEHAPEEKTGYFVLAMGKYGAFELNYSSDIDLIVLYDQDRIKLKDGLEPSVFFVKVTRDLVRLLQERTADGYVFRTDLRLRPDPGSTQVALSTDAALIYYESMGQNWERAVFIKARPVVGDMESATSFLQHLSPFVWRKYLDFASINEVHTMKRQIHAHKGHGAIAVAGHNIKLGRGGIREIEFFAQTQQLIAGGRQEDLRTCATLETLERLVDKKWVERDVADSLHESYLFLRHVEHRLQMVADEQTHTLPKDPEALEKLACFSGFQTCDEFSQTLKSHLESVQAHYAALFEDVPTAGADCIDIKDLDTVTEKTETELTSLGFTDPDRTISIISNWRTSKYPAMRSSQARNRLDEFLPVLLEALSNTTSPDQALISFDRFLANLPAGIQLFSLLKSNPNLLRLIADIMGTAPRLSQFLSRHSRVLDAVLDPGFFGVVPSDDVLKEMIEKVIEQARDYQDILDSVRAVGQEQSFLIGVRTLSGTISSAESGYAYARLAEFLVDELALSVQNELKAANGAVKDGEAAVLAMGKLGGREMTASSDLDLIVIYDFDKDCIQSDGDKPIAPTQYYGRFTQRLISALSAPTSYGKLYEVDTRLRPSGRSGPLATRLDSFEQYQKKDAWTWEHMALTRARIISGPEKIKTRLQTVITDILTTERDPQQITRDVLEMRERISQDRGTTEHWHIKLVRGGLLDIEFITQYLQLIHAHKHPEILDQNTLTALENIVQAGLLDRSEGEILIEAARLYHRLTQVLRLCVADHFNPDEAQQGLRELLARTNNEPAFSQLEARLDETITTTHRLFDKIIN